MSFKLADIETEIATLTAAQDEWPEMRAKELEAGQRLFRAVLRGDVRAGIDALCEAQEARASYLVYYAAAHGLFKSDPDAHLGAVGE